jgi:hypothetical protein
MILVASEGPTAILTHSFNIHGYHTYLHKTRKQIRYSYGLRDGRPEFDYRHRQDLLFFTASRPALRPIQAPIQWVPWTLSPGVKRPRHETDHLPPPSAEVKNGGAINHFLILLHGVVLNYLKEDNFTLHFHVASLSVFVSSPSREASYPEGVFIRSLSLLTVTIITLFEISNHCYATYFQQFEVNLRQTRRLGLQVGEHCFVVCISFDNH